MRKVTLLLVAIVMMLSGCARWIVFGHTLGGDSSAEVVQPVSAPEPASAQSTVQPAAQPAAQLAAKVQSDSYAVSALAVSFTPAAKAKAAADPRFNAEGLRSAIESELRARNLLSDHDPRTGRTVDILIDDFATRSTSNAVMFGYTLGAGTLAANIEVRDIDGRSVQGFRIKADSRLVQLASGAASDPLQSLYSRFANMTVDNLAGTPGKSDVHSINQMP